MCKWNYSANPNGKNEWNEDFFEQLNLRDLKKDNWRKIGTSCYININNYVISKNILINKNVLSNFNKKDKKEVNYKKIQ